MVFRPQIARADIATLAGGMDARSKVATDKLERPTAEFFLNFRKVISENGADRWVFVLQGDSGENFKDPFPYQDYLQLKGPLGKWNVRVGRFIVPFGLLKTYDSERLILRTNEPVTLGIKLDEGIEVLGYTDRYDYSFAFTNGSRAGGNVFVARVGTEGEESIKGFSVLIGRLPEVATSESVERTGEVEAVELVKKVRVAFDETVFFGRDIVRLEIVGGTDNSKVVGGGYFEMERATSPEVSFGFNFGYFKGEEGRWRFGAGISRNFGGGRFLRVGYVRIEETKENANEIVLQYYQEFTKSL